MELRSSTGAGHVDKNGQTLPSAASSSPFHSMALRRRRQLQLEQHFETGASTIGSLPDDLLAKCFSQLEQEDL